MNGTIAPPPVPPESGPLDEIARGIAAAAPWMRFLSVLGFVGSGLLAFAGLILLATGLPDSPIFGRLLGLLYLAVAGVYLIPLVPLSRAATCAAGLKTCARQDLALDALRFQSRFWRRIGILSIVGVGLAILTLPVLIFAAIRMP